jgi:anti-sigma B factor antagonist
VNFFWRTRKVAALGAGIGIECSRQDAQYRVSLSGRITIDSAPDLRLLLLRLVQDPKCQDLTADFYDVAYIDVSGLAILVEILKAARAQGKKFRLRRLRERPRHLLEAVQLLHLFEEDGTEHPQVSSSSTGSAR